MALTARTDVMNERTATKVHRNHCTTATERESRALMAFNPMAMVSIVRGQQSLSTATRASQRSIVYRFAWVNAIFNPLKVLLGDDMDCLKDDDRQREWLDE
jgi:hypothetical protein